MEEGKLLVQDMPVEENKDGKNKNKAGKVCGLCYLWFFGVICGVLGFIGFIIFVTWWEKRQERLTQEAREQEAATIVVDNAYTEQDYASTDSPRGNWATSTPLLYRAGSPQQEYRANVIRPPGNYGQGGGWR